MAGKPVAFADLPASAYPLEMVWFVASGREVYRLTVEGPAAIEVPPLARMIGQPVGLRIEYADGRVEVSLPPGLKP